MNELTTQGLRYIKGVFRIHITRSKWDAGHLRPVRSMDAEYLRRSVGSELAQACAAAACQRPDNAVEFLATWLHRCAP